MRSKIIALGLAGVLAGCSVSETYGQSSADISKPDVEYSVDITEPTDIVSSDSSIDAPIIPAPQIDIIQDISQLDVFDSYDVDPIDIVPITEIQIPMDVNTDVVDVSTDTTLDVFADATNQIYAVSFVGVSALDNSVLEALTVRLFSAAVAKEDLNATEPVTICEPSSADSVVTDCEVPHLGVYQFQIYAKDGSTSMRIGLVDVVENAQHFELQVMEEHALTPTQQIEYNNSFLEYFKRRSHTTDTYTVEYEDGTTETFKNEVPIVATYEKLMNGEPLNVYVPSHVSNNINVADAVRDGLDAVHNKIHEVLPDFELFQYVSSADEADVVVDMVSKGNSKVSHDYGPLPGELLSSVLYIGNGIAFGLVGDEGKAVISAVASHELDHVVYDSGHSLVPDDLMFGSHGSLTMNNSERNVLLISTRLNERNMSNYQPVPQNYK